MSPEPLEERRIAVTSASAAVRTYAFAVIAVAAITIAGVVAAAVLAPTNTSLIAVIVGVTSPIILSLISGGMHSMAVSMDGRLSQIVRITEEKARAQGMIQGLKENPNTNIT